MVSIYVSCASQPYKPYYSIKEALELFIKSFDDLSKSINNIKPFAKWGMAAFPYSMIHASNLACGRFLEHGFNCGAVKSLK